MVPHGPSSYVEFHAQSPDCLHRPPFPLTFTLSNALDSLPPIHHQRSHKTSSRNPSTSPASSHLLPRACLATGDLFPLSRPHQRILNLVGPLSVAASAHSLPPRINPPQRVRSGLVLAGSSRLVHLPAYCEPLRLFEVLKRPRTGIIRLSIYPRRQLAQQSHLNLFVSVLYTSLDCPQPSPTHPETMGRSLESSRPIMAPSVSTRGPVLLLSAPL